MLKKESAFKGGRKDVDKDLTEMNDEEKAIFDVLDNANIHNHQEVTIGVEGDYEELDDDFILALNGGVPALELIDKEPKTKHNTINDEAGMLIEDLPPVAGKDDEGGMIDNYKERMADVIAQLEKQEDFKKKQ